MNGMNRRGPSAHTRPPDSERAGVMVYLPLRGTVIELNRLVPLMTAKELSPLEPCWIMR